MMGEQTKFLSDDLVKLTQEFARFEHGGFVMNGEEISAMVKAFKRMGNRACTLENDLLRHEAFARTEARRQQEVINKVVNEANRPGSNLVCFNFNCPMFREASTPTDGDAA